jgi:molecular chaperone DnaK (HSP70)
MFLTLGNDLIMLIYNFSERVDKTILFQYIKMQFKRKNKLHNKYITHLTKSMAKEKIQTWLISRIDQLRIQYLYYYMSDHIYPMTTRLPHTWDYEDIINSEAYRTIRITDKWLKYAKQYKDGIKLIIKCGGIY